MDTGPSVTFATLLRRYRIAAGLTQEELAERAGISQRSLGDMERGVARTPRKDTLALVATALGLSERDCSAFMEAARRLGASAVSIPAPPTSAPFVGRTRELALLERHLAGEGPPLLVLAGEPGIGKTRLLHAALPRAVAHGLRVLEGGCQRRGGQEPYAPLLGALRRCLRSRQPAPLRAELQGCAWLVRLLPELAEGPIPPLPAWALSPEQERRLMGEAVGRLLANVAGPAGTLLVLDDLQWASPDALDLLATLVHAAGEVPLRVLAAYRDTEAPPQAPLANTLADLAQAGLAARRRLDPLAAEDAASLLQALFEEDAHMGLHDAALRERVVQRTGGVPFFLVSWAQAARLAGPLPAGATDANAMPWDVSQSIRQRVAALPEAARELLGVAAVGGRVVEPALLTATTPHPEGEVLSALDLATQVGLLQEETQTYRFAHDVIREVVEADLGLARRLALHRRVAEALERAQGERPELAAELAQHFLAGGDRRKASHYAVAAGDYALGLYAAEEAVGQYQAVLDLLLEEGDAAAVAEVRRKLGGALHDLGRREEALAAYALALATFEQRGDVMGQARVHRDVAWVHQFIAYDLAAAGPHLEAALALWPPEREDGELARLLLEAARARHFGRDNTAAAGLAQRGLALAERLGDVALRAHALLVLAYARLAMGTRPRDVIALLDEAEAGARRAGDLQLLGRIYNQRGNARWATSDFAGCYADKRRALHVNEQIGLPSMIAIGAINLVIFCMFAGDWVEGRALLRKARALDPDARPHDVAALLAALEGDRDRAYALAQEQVAHERRLGNTEGAHGLEWQAWWSLFEGRLEEAEALAKEMGTAPGYGGFLAEVLARRGSPDAADLLEQAERHMEQTTAEDMRLGVLRARGLLLQRQGDLEGALAAFQAGVDLARAQGDVLQLGLTLADLAAVARKQGAAAEAVAADGERAALVERIGPEIRRLGWLWTDPTP